MATDVLKEFLISLGFGINEDEYRRFNARVDSTEAKLSRFAKDVVAAGTGMAVGIVLATDKIADLAFAAQRAGTSFTNLKAIEYGFKQIGLSADTAQSAAERLANNLATFDPSTLLTFARVGLKPVKDQVENFLLLMDRLRKMGPEGSPGFRLAAMLAQRTMGIDVTTFRMLAEHPEQLRGFFQQNLQMGKVAGVTDEAGKQAIETFQKIGETTEKLSFQEISAIDKLDKGADRLLDWGQRALDWLAGVNAKTGGFLSAAGFSALSSGVGAFAGRLARGLFGGGSAATAGAGAAEGGAGLLGPLAGLALPIAAAYGNLRLMKRDPELAARLSEGQQEADAAAGTWELVKKFEHLSLSKYSDFAGKLTIGWGHLIRAGETVGQFINNGMADKLFAGDINSAQSTIGRLVKTPLNKNQMDALTDFVFNVGSGNFAKSTLLQMLNSGDYAGAAKQFERWDKVTKNGVLVPSTGLASRRLEEEQLFNKPVTINQKTEINVSGTSDPQQTAKAVSGQQTRVNGDLVRNLKATVK